MCWLDAYTVALALILATVLARCFAANEPMDENFRCRSNGWSRSRECNHKVSLSSRLEVVDYMGRFLGRECSVNEPECFFILRLQQSPGT